MVLLLCMCLWSEFFVTVEKRNGTDFLCRRAGATPRNFWAAWPQKSGVAPARFSLFSTVTFLALSSASPSSPRNCSHLAVKKQEKKKVQSVILTFFTLFPQSPVQERLLDEPIPYRNTR